MLKTVLAACALLCALIAPAAAEPSANFLEGIRSIDVVMTRDYLPRTCEASQYGVGDRYNGKRTASGEVFNTFATKPYTVAMRKPQPLGSFVTVTNLANGKSIRAKVTDRGPFVKRRCVDLGRAGANALGIGGTAQVRVSSDD